MAERNAIAVLIKLLGGEAMTEELKKLGDTGEKAMETIQDAAKKVEFAGLGNNIANVIAQAETVAKRSLIAFGILKGAADAVGASLFFLAKSGAEAADEAGKAAQAAGLSAKAYQEWAFAAGSVDVSQKQVSTALDTFNKQVIKTADETVKATNKIKGAGKSVKQFGQDTRQANADITQGAGYTIQAFKDIGVEVTRFGAAASKVKAGTTQAKTGFDELGIKVKNSNGTLKTNEQLLIEVANAFQKMPDGARKSQIALKLFGEAGAKLIPLLDQGAAGIDEFKAKAAELGIVFTDDQIKAAAKFNDALNELQKAVGGVLRGIGLIFVPSFTTGANAFRDLILRNRAVILDFATNALAKAKVLVADFFAALSGRDADVTSNRWIITLRDAIVGFGEDARRVITGLVIPAIEKIKAAADLAAKGLNALSGAGLTGGELLVTFAILRATGALRGIIEVGIIAVKTLAGFSTFLVANPWALALTAVAGGIALWATRTDSATAALQRHEGLVEGVAGAYAKAGNNVKNMTDEIKNGLLIQERAALQDLVPAFEAELKRLRDLAAAPAKENPFSQALRDFAAGGSLDDYLKAVKAIGAANPDLNAAADAFVHLTDKATELETKIKPASDFVDLLTGKISDATYQARQAGAGFQALGADAEAGLSKAGATADTTKGKVEALGQTITVFRGGASGISKEVFDVVNGVAQRADQGKQAVDGLKNSVDDTSKAVGDVSGEITNSIGTIAPAAQQAADGFNSSLGSLDAGAAKTAAEAIVAPFNVLPGQFSTILGGIRALLQGGFSGLQAVVSSLASQIETTISRILSALRAAADAAAQLRAQASGSAADGGGHGGFAGGGHVRGAGTGTSDSILAWLSNGEYIMTAEAVKRIGVGVLNAWNYSGDAFRGLKGFNAGGVVSNFSQALAIPRYAGGGLAMAAPAAAGAPSSDNAAARLFLQFNGGTPIDAGMIGDIAMHRLQKEALRSAWTSLGRSPRRGT